MQKKKWMADEMEMCINFKSIRVSYVFSVIALLAYCIFKYAVKKELPFIPFIILCGELFLFYTSKLYLTKKMTGGSPDEE
jgi:hypothetical protein